MQLDTLSRRELQYLARELALCRGNAKSEVIVQHLESLLAASPDASVRVKAALDGMPEDMKLRTPSASASATPRRRKRESSNDVVTPRAMVFDEETPRRRSQRKAAQRSPPVAAESVDEKDDDSKSAPVARRVSFDAEPEQEEAEPAPAQGTIVEQSPKGDVASSDDMTSSKGAAPVVEETAAHTSGADRPEGSVTPETRRGTKTKSPGRTSPASSRSPVKTHSPLNAAVTNGATDADSIVARADSAVRELVDSHEDLVFIDSSRVKCVTTGHEMKADLKAISAHVSGKRYKRARSQAQSFAAFAPMFVPHPDENLKHMLWCRVTESAVARDISRVEAHIRGSRYQKQLPEWQAEHAASSVAETEDAGSSEESASKRRRVHG
ncbi:hypothetical protein PINS_up019287 [Pythium insidiosum]|nr:hypothetical protein PINS_up019287 [Pythium insidiosum]